ncbi:hypothetical protein C5S53_07840 [Methanophagales archaeon]|nr:hypothetical protein C5S53_07840 [Methanophagales archaeon]
MEEEKYISGYKSSNFQKVGQKKIGGSGYGIYATNKRIFLVKISVIDSLKDSAKGALLDTLVLSNLSTAMSGKVVRAEAIEDLEDKKDIEILKEDISEIELKKPSALGFRGGFLKIRTKDGEPLQITIPTMIEFKKV